MQKELKEFLEKMGTDGFGFVLLSEHPDIPQEFHPKNLLMTARSVVVLCRRMPKTHYKEYEMEAYNRDFDRVIEDLERDEEGLCLFLRARHAQAASVPCDEESETGCGAVSLRHLAVLAGLGTLGRNGLLLAPDLGCMCLLGAVVTDAALAGSAQIFESLCDGCGACLAACPHGKLDALCTAPICRTTTCNNGAYSGCAACRLVCGRGKTGKEND